MRSAGIVAATARRSSDFLNVTMPAKLMYSPSSTHSAAVSAVPVNECMTPRKRPAATRLAEHASMSASLSRMWTMNGRLALLRQPQVAVEIVLLHVERRVVPMAVEPRLAERHDARAGRPAPTIRSQSPGCGLRRVVRLNADRGEDARVAARPDRTTASLDAAVTPTATIASTPACRGPRNHRVTIGVELFLVEMGVRVDERHDAHALR